MSIWRPVITDLTLPFDKIRKWNFVTSGITIGFWAVWVCVMTVILYASVTCVQIQRLHQLNI